MIVYVEMDRGCGLRVAQNVRHGWRQAEREVGENNVRVVRPATREDVNDVASMGGYVPLATEAHLRRLERAERLRRRRKAMRAR